MKKILLAIAVVAMAAGCSLVDENVTLNGKHIIRVTSDEGTRTEIVTDDDVTFRHNWVKDDAIALFDATTILKYTVVGEGGSTTADFSGEEPTKQNAPYYAMYPYKDNIDIYNDATHQSKFLYEFPAEIEYVEGSNMAGSNVMIGFTDGKSLNMKNACSYIRISLSSPFLSFLDEIEIIARGGENIAGPHLVGIDGAGVPFTEFFPAGADAGTTVKDYSRVVIKFPETKFLTANTDMFYIPLPAVELSEGLAFVLKGDFGGEPTLNLTSSTATLERNTVLVMEEYRLPSEEARIGDVVYETVADAFAAASESNEDVTITLLRTCYAGSPLNITKTGTGDVTLNLNGKQLTVNAANRIAVYGRNFTVTDSFSDDPKEQGTIEGDPSNTTSYTIRIEDGGNLNWEKGNLRTTGWRAIYLTTGSNATVSGGTIITTDQMAIAPGASAGNIYIKDGAYISTGEQNSIYMFGGTLYMDGGTVINTSGAAIYAYQEGSVAIVSGGYVSSGAVNPVGMSSGVCHVTGGCYNKAVQVPHATGPDASKYVNTLNPDPATSGDYPFMVVPRTEDPEAHGVRGAYEWDFETIDCAVYNSSMTAGVNTVVVMKDCTAESTLGFSNSSKYPMTLDLNGKKISSSTSPAMKLANGSVLTIMDSSEDSNGEVATTGATALETAGTLNFNAGSLVAATNAVAVTGGILNAFGGYFYGGTTADVVNNGGQVALSSGWYRNQPSESLIATGCGAKVNGGSFNGRTYGYKVVTTDVAAEVNGEGYASLEAAVAAAMDYTGSDDVVNIKLFKPAECATALNLTNTAGKNMVLDLNGQTITTDVYQFLSASNELLITDSSEAPGSIVSSQVRLFYLHGSSGNGTVTVEKVTLKSTFDYSTNSETGAASNAALYVYSNSAGTKTLNLKNGAKVITPLCHCLYGGGNADSTPAFINIENAELTAGRYCIYFGTCTVSISGNETSFYTENKHGSTSMYCGTSNPNGKCHITGGYFYSEGSAPFNKNYASHYTFGGGYFCAALAGSPKYDSGYSQQDCSVTHTHKTNGKSLTYIKKVAN